MTKKFIEKVQYWGTVYTKKYKYRVEECYNAEKAWGEIKRLPIKDLNTTKSLTEWETVYRWE